MAKLATHEIERGKLDLVRERIAQGVPKEDLEACLCKACEVGALDIAKALVLAGTDVNCHPSQSGRYYSPLHSVAEGERDFLKHKNKPFTFSHLCLLFYLLSKGADMRSRAGAHGEFGTPIHTAIRNHRYHLLPLLASLYAISFVNPWSVRAQPARACPRCGKGLKHRRSSRQIVAGVDAARSLARMIHVTEEYCPKCGHVANHDVFGDVRGEQENLGRMARR